MLLTFAHGVCFLFCSSFSFPQARSKMPPKKTAAKPALHSTSSSLHQQQLVSLAPVPFRASLLDRRRWRKRASKASRLPVAPLPPAPSLHSTSAPVLQRLASLLPAPDPLQVARLRHLLLQMNQPQQQLEQQAALYQFVCHTDSFERHAAILHLASTAVALTTEASASCAGRNCTSA